MKASRILLLFLAASSLLLLVTCVKPLPVPELEKTRLALAQLPRTHTGEIDWVTAIREGTITPREDLDPSIEHRPSIDLDIVFRINKALTFPDVLFPHEPHTMWLDCINCHPSPFVMRHGANPISMDQIIKGEFCGRCHGIVAFPIQDCFRCHSRKRLPAPTEESTQ